MSLHALGIILILSCKQISEEEGRLKKDEEETKEMWKRKREHEEKWEETRETRVFYTFNVFLHLTYFLITADISNFLLTPLLFLRYSIRVL